MNVYDILNLLGGIALFLSECIPSALHLRNSRAESSKPGLKKRRQDPSRA